MKLSICMYLFQSGCSIPLILQLLATLNYLATGSFQLCVADTTKMSRASVSRFVKSMSGMIASLAPTYIKFPTPDEARLNTQGFFQIAGMPGVLGCIDGTHIPIRSPGGDNAEHYRCRKDFMSLNVEAVCDSDLKFTDIVCSWPGSVHDARIFENSHISTCLEQDIYRGMYLLGDRGYPCRRYLLTPIPNPITEKERNYNVAHVKTRNCVERSFGVLKKRFNCLKIALRTELRTTKTIIMACAVLHNWAIDYGLPLEEDDDDQEEEEDDDVVNADTGIQMRNVVVEQWF